MNSAFINTACSRSHQLSYERTSHSLQLMLVLVTLRIQVVSPVDYHRLQLAIFFHFFCLLPIFDDFPGGDCLAIDLFSSGYHCSDTVRPSCVFSKEGGGVAAGTEGIPMHERLPGPSSSSACALPVFTIDSDVKRVQENTCKWIHPFKDLFLMGESMMGTKEAVITRCSSFSVDSALLNRLVVEWSLLRVRQNFVCFNNFFEFLLSFLLVSGILIRMPF